MAKTPNGLGQYSGKVGGVVYAVQNGQQVVRSYQPVVSNPKSLAQRKQRAKANLVGRISQITPWQILEGLGSNKRARRSRFLALGMRYAVVPEQSSNPNSITAKLMPSDFRFSEGAVMPTAYVSNVSLAAQSISVTLTRFAGVDAPTWAISGMLVVAVVMASNGSYEHIYYRFVSSSEFNESTFSFQMFHISEGTYVANLYIAPFEVTDSSALAIITSQLSSDANAFAATLSANPSALPLVWGNSEFQRSDTFTPGN